MADLGADGYGLNFVGADMATRVLLSDYLASSVISVRTNLREAGWSLDRLRLINKAMGRRTHEHLQNPAPGDERQPMPAPTPEADYERIERDAVVASFFRALGSALDNLAVATAIICSRPVEVVGYFTWGTLMARGFQVKKGQALDDEGGCLLRWLRLSVDAAGPAGASCTPERFGISMIGKPAGY